jgi:hypothetical protein
VSDGAELGRDADAYESKYGPHFAAPDGTWSGLGDAIRRAEIPLHRVAPATVFGFGKGEMYVRQGGYFPSPTCPISPPSFADRTTGIATGPRRSD